MVQQGPSRKGAHIMTTERKVRRFRIGPNQAMPIPRAFGLPDEGASMLQEGERLIIQTAAPNSLLAPPSTTSAFSHAHDQAHPGSAGFQPAFRRQGKRRNGL